MEELLIEARVALRKAASHEEANWSEQKELNAMYDRLAEITRSHRYAQTITKHFAGKKG